MTNFRVLNRWFLTFSCLLSLTHAVAMEGTSNAPAVSPSSKDSPSLNRKILLSYLNTADLKGLSRIPGVGSARAATIQKYRPIENLDELILLPGFGEKTVRTILNSAPSRIEHTRTANPPDLRPRRRVAD